MSKNIRKIALGDTQYVLFFNESDLTAHISWKGSWGNYWGSGFYKYGFKTKESALNFFLGWPITPILQGRLLDYREDGNERTNQDV